MKLQMKLSQMEQVLVWKLTDIAWINNCESTNLIESLEMISQKGLEDELLHDTFMTSAKCIGLLKARMSFRNHCQRKYKLIVERELEESKNIFSF